jgi:serine protease Do
VVLDAAGRIVTNHHVVEGARRIQVTLHDGRRFDARVIGSDAPTDIAVIQLERPPSDLSPLPLAAVRSARLGEVVLAIGNPFGLQGSVTMGIVSATGRAGMGIVDYEDFIQTDAAINPGNSGGALVDLDGTVLGINTAIHSTSGGSNGIGFAVPAGMVRDIVDRLTADGKVVRSWLGVGIQDVDPGAAPVLGLTSPAGALVNHVEAETPAGKAGVRTGDVIVAVDAQPVQDSVHLRRQIALRKPGSDVAVDLVRDGEPLQLAVRLDAMPERGPKPATDAVASGADAGLGLSLAKVDAATLAREGYDTDGKPGLLITSLQPGSRGESAGLAPGDVILQADRAPVQDAAGLRDAARDGALLWVARQGASRFVWVDPPR